MWRRFVAPDKIYYSKNHKDISIVSDCIGNLARIAKFNTRQGDTRFGKAKGNS
jgi:hypothetical protein